MINMGIIHGSKAMAVPIVVGYDTVYIHTDIKKVETEYGFDYQYNEIQYTKNEYIETIAKNQIELENAVCEADTANDMRMTETEDALCELDTIGGM